MTLRIERAKTECPFCGNVWQEHTLNEVDGCMAITHLQFSVAVARSGTEQNKAKLRRWAVEPCPVCNKFPAEHTEADLMSRLSKWRAREQGTTGLELQREFGQGRGKNEEPDPVKRAQFRAPVRQRLCSCRIARGDHTLDEILACARRNRGD